jgi:hypothetical protein
VVFAIDVLVTASNEVATKVATNLFANIMLFSLVVKKRY